MRKLLTDIQVFEFGKLVPAQILINNGKIIALGNELNKNDVEIIPGHDLTLLPGFIDLHTHGAIGHEMLGIDEASLQELTLFYARHGVTGFLASPWTAPREVISDSLQVIKSVMGKEKGTRILGAHLEGPWLNSIFCGAQAKNLIRPAERIEALEYLNTGIIKLVAIAPEIPENLWLIKECARRGITVAAGHTNATYEEIQRAVNLGVQQVTHCFNAMRPLNHREPGVVGAAMTMPELKCELIADNIHVNPAVMNLLYKVKGAEGIILISDSISAAGLPDGEYKFQGENVIVHEGAVRLADDTLAGSTLTLDRALRNFIIATGKSLAELIPCSSTNAAAAIGLDQSKGRIAVGYDADLILVDNDLNVKMTMVNGNVVFNKI